MILKFNQAAEYPQFINQQRVKKEMFVCNWNCYWSIILIDEDDEETNKEKRHWYYKN